jgi:hypothetical protein
VRAAASHLRDRSIESDIVIGYLSATFPQPALVAARERERSDLLGGVGERDRERQRLALDPAFVSRRARNGRLAYTDWTVALAHERPAQVEAPVPAQREGAGDLTAATVVLDIRVVLANLEAYVIASPRSSVDTDWRLIHGHEIQSCQGQNERNSEWHANPPGHPRTYSTASSEAPITIA